MTTTTITGNLTAAPELRFTDSGDAVANFTIASTPRKLVEGEWTDGDTLFIRCSVWRQQAEHLAESLAKGNRVIATGKLAQSNWETEDGEKRSTFELEVEEVGASLRFAELDVKQPPAAAKPQGKQPAKKTPYRRAN